MSITTCFNYELSHILIRLTGQDNNKKLSENDEKGLS
jgi:hypothetical protein